jgi:hypothetical protein
VIDRHPRPRLTERGSASGDRRPNRGSAARRENRPGRSKYPPNLFALVVRGMAVRAAPERVICRAGFAGALLVRRFLPLLQFPGAPPCGAARASRPLRLTASAPRAWQQGKPSPGYARCISHWQVRSCRFDPAATSSQDFVKLRLNRTGRRSVSLTADHLCWAPGRSDQICQHPHRAPQMRRWKGGDCPAHDASSGYRSRHDRRSRPRPGPRRAAPQPRPGPGRRGSRRQHGLPGQTLTKTNPWTAQSGRLPAAGHPR